MEYAIQIGRNKGRHETDRRITRRGGGRKQAGLRHKHAILCSQFMAHSFLSHTHVQCSHTLPHIIHNALRLACLKHLLHLPTQKLLKSRVCTFLFSKLPAHKVSNYQPGIQRCSWTYHRNLRLFTTHWLWLRGVLHIRH